MAGRISVSEFFLKNRHLLGFDTHAKSLVTAVKEAVDNALDACEEDGVLPEITVEVLGVLSALGSRSRIMSRALSKVRRGGPHSVEA